VESNSKSFEEKRQGNITSLPLFILPASLVS